MVLVAVALSLDPTTTARTFLPPQKKKYMGQLMGYQESSGAVLRNRGTSLGKARKLRFLLGMTRSQGPSQGPSATASISATSRRVSMDKTGKTRLKLFLRTQQDLKRHSWLDMWTGSMGTCSGLESAATGGIESAADLPQELKAGMPHELQVGLGEPHTVAGLGEPQTVDSRHSRRSCRTPTPK